MLKGRTAIITGGTRGIGLAVAKSMAKQGANIAVTASGTISDEVLNELSSFGGKCRFYRCDVSDADSVANTVKTIVCEFGNIDILVNNAGITSDKLLLSMTEEDFDRVISVNLKGTFLMVKACIRHFIKNRYGRIVNLSSVVGMSGNAGQINYASSKAGVIGLTKSVAKEYASRGITCNAVAPGYILTSMTEKMSEEAKSAVLSKIPVGKYGVADDVANAVCFLAREESGYITGSVIKVDGGLYI